MPILDTSVGVTRVSPFSRNIGTTGANTTGLQVFIPLSARHAMVLYDGTIYDYVHNHRVTSEDVGTLNKMQLMSANTNIYFKDWGTRGEIESIANTVRELRNIDTATVEEWGSQGDENESMIHLFDQPPNISLDLSFLRVKKKALRKPLLKRVNAERKQLRNRLVRWNLRWTRLVVQNQGRVK